jgi:DNA-binding LacI/PurR family transcriptional regulator
LSTVSIDKQELGAAAMRTLVQLLNGEYSSEHYQQTVESKLVLRGTTAVI